MKCWNRETMRNFRNEPVNQWIDESMNAWTSELSVNEEPMNHSIRESNEAMNRWINDSVNQWINDSGNQRINQSKQRNNEPMNHSSETTNQWNNQWSDELHESLNQWISETFNHWTNESMKAGLSDCMNQWIKEWTNEGMDGWVNYFFVDLLLHWGTSSLSYFFWPAFAVNCLPAIVCSFCNPILLFVFLQPPVAIPRSTNVARCWKNYLSRSCYNVCNP